jgi:hypothetical protein
MKELDRKSDSDNYADNPKCLFHIDEGLGAFMSAVKTAGVNHSDLMREWGFDLLTPEFFDRVREKLMADGFDYDHHVIQFLKATEQYDRELARRLRGLGPRP